MTVASQAMPKEQSTRSPDVECGLQRWLQRMERLVISRGAVLLVFALLAPFSSSRAIASPEASTRRELIARLRSEFSELERRQKAEMADLKASQKARRKQFEVEAQNQRRDCFRSAVRGSEKRACVQDFLGRRKTLIQMMSEELTSRKNEQQVRRRSLEEDHRRQVQEWDSTRSKPAAP
ncbi:MAG: hypothetical protein RJB38_461 [Pseudomonadota bacterium]|jgi:hypothetical protein